VGLSGVGVIRCVVRGCVAMASTGAKKRTMGMAPVDAPMAHGSPPLPGGGQSKLCRMVGDAKTMQSLLPADRRVETMQAFGDLLEDPMMDRLLQPEILKNVRQEFDKRRPMLDVLAGCTSAGRDSETMKKDRVQVEHAAGVVYDWLCHDSGSVLGFLQVLSSGGISYSAEFSDKVQRFSDGAAAIDPMRLQQGAATITKSRYKSTMVARLCLEDRVVGLYSLMLDDCASTQIGDDSSDEFDPTSVVDGLMPPQSMFGRRHDTFACYRQLHAGGVGGSSMECQSRGALHVHSLAFGSALAEGAPIEKRQSLRRTERVAAQVLFPQKCYRPPSAGGGAGESV